MADVPADEQIDVPRRRFALWHLLRRLSWIALVGAVIWFVLREVRPGLATLGSGAVFPLIGVAGLVLGAMLVGAKLALAPPGQRPAFNDMIALFVAPAFALLLAAWGLNHIGGGPEQQFVAPVTDLVKEKSGTRYKYRVETLSPDGERHDIVLASGVASKKQEQWDNFAGFRRGECARLTWRIGSLGQMIYGDAQPIACPPAHGQPPPDGPWLYGIDMVNDRVTDWVWRWPEATEGVGFEGWYQDLLVVARRHQADLAGTTLTLAARIDPDGRISAVRVQTPDLDPAIAKALAATLVGRQDALHPPEIPNTSGETVWATVPLRLTIE